MSGLHSAAYQKAYDHMSDQINHNLPSRRIVKLHVHPENHLVTKA